MKLCTTEQKRALPQDPSRDTRRLCGCRFLKAAVNPPETKVRYLI
jgi:hypothetical protein